MSLNNVYYWKDGGWKKITAEEFVKNNPGIKISAKDKNFWCEMCGQFVGLAKGDKNRPHFRHSAESEKFCEDRSKNFYKADWLNAPKPMHSLPIKICVEQNNFRFQVGLIRLPIQLFNSIKNCRIKIKVGEKILYHNVLSDCLIEEKTTWIDIKDIPEESYSLTLEPEISEVNFYWNREIKGVNFGGTLFDKLTGKKILYDADIKVNSEYFLLIDELVLSTKDVDVKVLLQKYICRKWWRLYEVKATALTEEAAKFFLHYHCRLTAKPISIIPIYPIYTQENNIVHCNSARLFFYFSGNAKINFFPSAKNSTLIKEKNFKIIETEFNERYGMMAAGRSELLQYTYIWKDLPNFETPLPQVKVTDIKGKVISDGAAYTLPKNSRLQVTAEFDGKVIVTRNNVTQEKIFFKAGTPFDIKNITFGIEIKIFQGLDCVRKISYRRKEKGISTDDTEIFLKLECGRGKKIQIPHTWGSLADKLKNYPQVQSWLYKSIRFGFVYEESYLLFKQFILKVV